MGATLAGSVELTFDDGPDPVWTPAVLAALRGSPVRATFFVMGSCAEAHPELVSAIVAGGHSVELHCYEHLRHSDSSREAIAEDADRALAVLAGVGIHPRRWRTPAGARASWSQELADERGLELYGWDVDTNDWQGHRAEAMLATVGPELYPGAVVLLHDAIGPGALRTDCEETVRFVQLIAAEAVEAA